MDYNWIETGLQLSRPELLIIGGTVAVIMLSIFKQLSRTFLFLCSCAILIGAGYITLLDIQSYTGQTILFKGAIGYDKFSLFFKMLFIAIAFITMLFSYPVIKNWTSGFVEFLSLLLCCTLGMIYMASSRTFLMMFLNLEFVSITSYIMAGLLRHNKKSIEASLKYIIYGAGSSGIMLFGMSFLYAITGSIDVYTVGNTLRHLDLPNSFYLITSILILAGFAYKMAIVPFHMWCPDVYEGAPTPVTAFFSTGPKIAGFAMMIRFVDGVFGKGSSPFEWQLIFIIVSVLSMLIGNLTALQQNNLKRLMAYSGIAHAGYMALIFLTFTQDSIGSLLFYSVIYSIMNLGAFITIIILEKYYNIDNIQSSAGFAYTNPFLAICLSIFMFSLVGLPPFAGFFSKLLVFMSVIKPLNYLTLFAILVAVITTVISLFYYVKIIGAMFLKQGGNFTITERVSLILNAPMAILALATVAIFITDWDWLFEFCKSCSL
ncbi:MAG: NADH-quinone oxidoreductase subunit N [Planctomycetes bacterium]|nr:NADH-quinone oxidoreductase subunit N [Planctomycetota bacterium]